MLAIHENERLLGYEWLKRVQAGVAMDTQ